MHSSINRLLIFYEHIFPAQKFIVPILHLPVTHPFHVTYEWSKSNTKALDNMEVVVVVGAAIN